MNGRNHCHVQFRCLPDDIKQVALYRGTVDVWGYQNCLLTRTEPNDNDKLHVVNSLELNSLQICLLTKTEPKDPDKLHVVYSLELNSLQIVC